METSTSEALELAKTILQETKLHTGDLQSLGNILTHLEIAHLKMMVNVSEDSLPSYLTPRGDYVNIMDLSSMLLDIDRIAKGKEMLTNNLVDWTVIYLYNLDNMEHVRLVSTSTYAILTRRLATIRKLSHTMALPASELATLFKYNKDLDRRLRRKVIGAETFSKIELMNALAQMRSMGPNPIEKTMLNATDGIYAVVVMKLIDAHFSFVVFDAEMSERAEEPVMVYFDSRNSTVDPNTDSLIAQFAGICTTNGSLIHTVLGVDQKDQDEWSCGYRSLSRARDVMRWLNTNRVYDSQTRRMGNEMPIAKSDGLALKAIDTDQCRSIAKKVRTLTAAALLYLHYRNLDSSVSQK